MNLHFGVFGWLLKPLMALCMLGFASAGTALGGDMGGGLDIAGGEGSGEEGGGEFGSDEGGEEGDGGGEEDLGGEDDLGAGEGGRQRTQQLTPQQKADAAREARLPANVKKALGAVKETDPKAAEVLRRAVFATQAWSQVMPGGIRQAREMAQAFEEVGGVEGIQGLRDETQSLQAELDNIDEQWTSASPEFIAGLADQDPEAFTKVTPIVLEQLRKTDKDSYNALMGRIFYNTLGSSGVLNALQQMWSLAQSNKAAAGMAGILEGLQGILQWEAGIRELAASQPERKPDKTLERLKQREKEFETKQSEGFKKEVGGDVKRHLETGILREVGKLLKARNVNLAQLRVKDKDRFESMVAEADRQLTQAIMKDRAFHQQKDRLMQTRDKDRVLRLYQQKIDYLLADPRGPKIASKVAKIFFSGMKPVPRPGGQNGGDRGQGGGQGDRGQRSEGGQNGGGRVERVGGSPNPMDIDRSRTTDDMILDGTAWLKSGKQVRWRG